MVDINALVESGTFNFGLRRGRNRVVFQNPRGNKYYYCFYRNQNSDIVYEYSTNGTSWSGSVYTIETGGISDYDVKFNDNGSSLDVFIVFYDSVDSDLMYIHGNITDAGSTISFDTKQAIDADITYEINATMSVAIARTDNGKLVVAFTEDYNTMGKDYRLTKIIGADGDGASPSWSDETTIDDPSGNTNNKDKIVYVGMESFSSSYPNRVMIYGKIPDATTSVSYQIKVWVYDWNGSAFSSVDSDSTYPAGAGITGDYISAIIDDDDRVHIVGRIDNVVDYFDHWKYPTAGGLGTETKYDITEALIDACTLTLDRTNDELYIFYHHSADSNTLHYKKTDAGTISWGSEESLIVTDIPAQLSSWNSDVELFLHLSYVDDDGDVYYYGLDLVPCQPQTDSRIADASASWQGACDVDITGWDKADEFILSTYAIGGDNNSKSFQLQWKEAGGGFLNVTDITEIAWGNNTVLINEQDVQNPAGCLTSTKSEENEGDSLAFLDNMGPNDIGEIQWALDPALAKDDTIYEFRLRCISELTIAVCSCSIRTSAGAPTAYKDITLKTSLESALTYKDITLKTTLDALDYKDIALKTTLDSLDYKDIALKTTLESIPIYKDVTVKTSLDSLDYKDITLKTTLESALTYKDIVLKTTLESALTYKDIALKTTLESIPIYKDITVKTSLHSLDYKDVTLKTTLESASTYKDISIKTSFTAPATYKDITLKTTLESNLTYKDVAIKTSLHLLDYKDIVLKTSLQSLDYKDIVLKTTLESALTYKDVAIKTSLESVPTYKDIVLKTTLESATTYKDITLKTSLHSLDYKDITLKTSLHSLDYKDITLKTTLESALSFKDVALKTTLESIPIYKDISLKTTLNLLGFKDVAIKTSLQLGEILGYKDIALKTSITSATTYKDISLKTSLDLLDYKDVALKTTLASLDYKDVTIKTSLDLLNYKDVALKTSISSAPSYKDISLKTTIASLNYKDITLKTTLESALTYKDISLKISMDSLDFKDISLKTTLDSLDYKDIPLKTTIDALDYKDIVLKTTLDSLDYKDITLKTTLESSATYKDISIKVSLESNLTYKDISLKTTLDSLTYKDIVLKTSLESALTYKDISLKTSLRLLQIEGYKDIALKTSLFIGGFKDISIKVSLEIIPAEIINFTSSITRTINFTSSIIRIMDLTSSITKIKNFTII